MGSLILKKVMIIFHAEIMGGGWFYKPEDRVISVVLNCTESWTQ